ncbi:CPBP family intramembrane metalloprotease [Candidatus Gracilibacteria bacterium]|nr:CPBP family intramembrane metalloprotease [Candidatus Gracilibacteria bacterium]
MKLTPKIIISYALIACTLLYITENVYHPVYLLQLIQKVISFVIIPVIIGYIFKTQFGRFGKITKQSFLYGLSLGILGGIAIFVAYYLLKEVIDWNAIDNSMESRKINESTFILVFTYIMFGNSLVEEYFFRGVIFNTLKDNYKISAYLLSSIAFSLYHITIFQTWFHGYILLIALFGLFLGGLFFAWLYKKTNGIWGAYIFHILADLVILVIGYYTFFYTSN